jgi:tetratricopeptide (TPR) repeat protein
MIDLGSRALDAHLPKLADLAFLPAAERCARVRACEDLRTPELLVLLLTEARGRGPGAAGWAQAAVEAAELPEDRALALALLGQAERRRARLVEADRAFAAVEALLPTTDAATRAEVLGLLGRWHAHLRDFRRAAALLAEALEIAPAGEHYLQLRIAGATVRGQAGDAAGAVLDLSAIALELTPSDAWLALVVGHNLASFLALAGEYDLAQRALVEIRPLYARVPGGQRHECRAGWIVARIALEQGQYETAVARLSAVAASLDLVDPIDRGLLDLERAHAALGCGRWAEAGQRATQAAGLLGSLGIRVEATAAAITAAEAIQAGTGRALAAVVAARRRMGA